jgi:hypothetical protein
MPKISRRLREFPALRSRNSLPSIAVVPVSLPHYRSELTARR